MTLLHSLHRAMIQLKSESHEASMERVYLLPWYFRFWMIKLINLA
jgi:hypothetical protein